MTVKELEELDALTPVALCRRAHEALMASADVYSKAKESHHAAVHLADLHSVGWCRPTAKAAPLLRALIEWLASRPSR